MSSEPSENLRPRDASGRPLPPMVQPGYYPGYSTVDQQNFWDEATRDIVLERLEPPPPLQFFSPEEGALLEAVCSHVLPQDDRVPERRIPLVPDIDQRLHSGRTPGYRFESMPPDGRAHRLGLEAIERMAQARHQQRFVALSWADQEAILKSVHDGKPLPGAEPIWSQLPVARFWALLVQDCIEVYYAHPWAWDEIGYGGPAYPRAYLRLEHGDPEPWEKPERRYRWQAPAAALSDPPGRDTAAHGEHPPQGQGGTH